MRSHESVRARIFGVVLVPVVGILAGCEAPPPPVAPAAPTPAVAPPPPPKGVKVSTDKSLKME